METFPSTKTTLVGRERLKLIIRELIYSRIDLSLSRPRWFWWMASNADLLHSTFSQPCGCAVDRKSANRGLSIRGAGQEDRSSGYENGFLFSCLVFRLLMRKFSEIIIKKKMKETTNWLPGSTLLFLLEEKASTSQCC